MAILVLRAIFVMVSVGLAVVIFNSGAMRGAPTWLPWAVLAGMIALPAVVIGLDAAIRDRKSVV